MGHRDLRVGVCLLLAVSTAATTVLATATTVAAQEISARDRQSAAEAYDRGTSAYLSEDFARAAQWFETAHRLAPASAALVQAVRAHERAGNALRAASLALQLTALYPDDRAAQRAARSALQGADGYLRVEVECEGCTVEVDGAILGHPQFFVEADAEHTVVASFETGNRSQTIRGAAGETRSLSFETPEPEAVVDEVIGDEAGDATPLDSTPAEAQGGGGVPLAVTITGMVITAGLGGVLIWSGVDALDGVPAYEANPTVEGLAVGRAREERTNWLIAGTSVAGAATVILMLLTDWGGGGEGGEVEPTVAFQPEGVMLGLRGRLP